MMCTPDPGIFQETTALIKAADKQNGDERKVSETTGFARIEFVTNSREPTSNRFSVGLSSRPKLLT